MEEKHELNEFGEMPQECKIKGLTSDDKLSLIHI